MTNKILGAAIIIGVICGVIFLIKFVPVYMGNAELEESFAECISWFKTYKEEGCRANFQQIIEKNNLNLSVNDIRINAAIAKPDSYVEAEYTQHIDFFGVWTYSHTFRPRHEGRPPDR